MAELFEDHRVGAHLKAHREHLGVSFAELIEAAGVGTDERMRWIERASHPAIALIERHHQALMNAYVIAEGQVACPMARREQWYATEADQTLWLEAVQTRPQIVWWWGVRKDAAPRGAWCYLCDRMIHGYDVGRGMTRRARQAVMAHRYEHLTDQAAPAATAAKGTDA
jgi:hypothetical protein